MKKLIIVAHPNPKSFTFALVTKYTELATAGWDSVEILDLYTTDLKQDFLRFENMKEMGKDETTRKLQEKITWANELDFFFPIWWGDAPAILKNFIDSNFWSGFAFQYVNGKPVGLLKGKTARIISTSGGPSFFYTIILHIQFLWNFNRIGFCGIRQKSFTVFGDINNPKKDKMKYLEKLGSLL